MARHHDLDALQRELGEHAEFIEQLRSGPAEEVVAIVQSLKAGSSISSALSSVRSNRLSLARPSELRTARSILPYTASGTEFELNLLHRLVYPALEPLGIDSVDLGSLFPLAKRTSPHVSRSQASSTPGSPHGEGKGPDLGPQFLFRGVTRSGSSSVLPSPPR